MPRHFWISASIAVLVAAFALLALALPRLVALDGERAGSQEAEARLQVATYPVPVARGDAIRKSLQSVLSQNPTPVGRADLAAPDRLVVSAPIRMQESIRKAIEELAESDAGATTSPASVAVEVWLVEATASAGAVDPRLASASAALEEARVRFGHAGHRLLDRGMTVARMDGHQVAISGAGSQTLLQLLSNDGDAVDAAIDFKANDKGGINVFQARMVLPADQWQLIGLLPNGNVSAPERLLLVRQAPVTSHVRKEQ